MRGRKRTESGFSIVELMIALTLELLLVAGVTVLVSNTGQNYRATSGAAQQVESGRYAMEILTTDLHLAGFFGRLSPSLVNNWNAPASLPDPCDVGTGTLVASLTSGIMVPVTGYDNVTTSPLSCITGGIVTGSDILVVRRADTTAITRANLEPGTVYVQTGNNASGQLSYVVGLCSTATSCAGKAGSNTGSTPVDVSGNPAAVFNLTIRDTADPSFPVALLRRYHLHVYYLRPWSTSATESPAIPTLVRLVLENRGGVPTLTTEPLIEGIENFQIQYGLDDGGGGAGVARDGTPDRYLVGASSLTPANWAEVAAVRLSFLARNLTRETSYVDTKVYNLAGQAGITPGGNYRRHAFVTVVRLTNVSTRKECRQEYLPLECL